jgi:hypothetical protein
MAKLLQAFMDRMQQGDHCSGNSSTSVWLSINKQKTQPAVHM